MKRNIRHIRAGNDEWVRVHRDATPAPSFSGDDWWVGLLLKIGGAILAFWVTCAILKTMLPFLVLAALGWFALTRLFHRRMKGTVYGVPALAGQTQFRQDSPSVSSRQ